MKHLKFKHWQEFREYIDSDRQGRRDRARTIRGGYELVHRASRADGELKAQIPWLRVFVEGVVIVELAASQ